jgi:type VI protein secretion system component Hcp
MAFNAYLVFHSKVRGDDFNQGIFGESTSKPEPGWGRGAIEITEYGFGVSMPVTSSRSDGGGATVGRAAFDHFTCNKNIDTATPWLVRYCCLGQNIPSIVLHIFRSGGTVATQVQGVEEGADSGAVKYAMVVFQNCVITKVGISGSGDELPKEQLEFNYGLCEYTYQYTSHLTGKTMSAVQPIRFCWSTVTNQELTTGQDFNKFEPRNPVEV